MKMTQKKPRRKTQFAMVFEGLENRTMMAETGVVDLEMNQFAPPPAIVEYAGITTDVHSRPVDPDDNQTKEQRSLGIYDATWGGSSFGRPTYWTSAAAWYVSGKLDIGRAAVERVANISQNGGKMVWRNYPVAPKTMTVLDFEHPDVSNRSPTFVADRLRWFKEKAPDVKVGVYGFHMIDGLNLDDCARWDARAMESFNRQILSKREVFDNSDFICFDAYILTEQSFERDMLARKNIADGFRQLFPDKPVIAFVWGTYSDAWNAPGILLSDERTQRYAEMAAQSYDAAMVWGKRVHNEKLITALENAETKLQPRGRLANWANDPVPQDPAPSSQPIPAAGGTSTTQPTIGEDVLGETPASP